MTTRRRLTADFKARVALEALRGDRSIQKVAARHQLHPNQVSRWTRQAVEGLADVFAGSPRGAASRSTTAGLAIHGPIG